LIETAIYVLIGACSAALVFLLAIPAISRRAHRLAQRRAALTAPLSAAEARADRDALRAKHAVEIALAERRAQETQAQWAEAQIALGRQAAELVARDNQLQARDEELARRADEIARLGETVAARDAALLDLAGQREAAERQAEQAAERLSAEQARFDADRADLEGRIAALSRELSDARQESNAALAAAQARVAELRRRLEASEAEAERLREPAPPPEPSAGPGLPRAYGLNEPAKTREKELDLRIGELMAARGEAEAALLAARVDRESLAREVAELRDRLSASESRFGRLKEGDGLLRQAIARLGREMAEGAADPSATPERERASTL
jgi:DNA repair exonuclease SbcCD ATPase subunit